MNEIEGVKVEYVWIDEASNMDNHDMDWLRYSIFFANPKNTGKIFKPKQKQKEENMDDSNDTFYGKTGIQAVKIIKCNNGWIVTIGCATFVTECRKKMFEALSEYWDDPVKAEKKYYKK